MKHSRIRMVAARRVLGCAAVLLLAGCIPPGVINKRDAVDPSTIAAIYIPTTQYDGWSCAQIAAEIQKINATMAEMGEKLRKGEYDNSGTLVVTPLFLMYDNTNALDDTPKKAQEYGRLKGTQRSLQEAAVKAHCSG